MPSPLVRVLFSPSCSPGLLATPRGSINSLDVSTATHREQLKPRTSELGQWLRFDGWLEARPALSWTAGLLAALLQHVGVVKLPLLRGLRVDVEKNRAGEALI
jgi:hypothetical protein